MTNRHSNDPSRFNRVEADLLLNGEQRTGPIAALMNAAAGPGSVREQTGEFVALTAFRAAEAATEPVPVARSGRHAAPATPFRLGLVLAAGLSRLLSPRILVGAIGVAAAVGVVVAMYAGSLGQPGRPDTASAPAMPAPAEAPVKDQVLPPAGVPAVPAPPPAAPIQPAPPAAEPIPAASPAAGGTAGRPAARPRPSRSPSAVPSGSGGARSAGGVSDAGAGTRSSESDSTGAGSGTSGSDGSESGRSGGGSLVEVNVLGIGLSL